MSGRNLKICGQSYPVVFVKEWDAATGWSPAGLCYHCTSILERGHIVFSIINQEKEENWSKQGSLGHAACQALPFVWDTMVSVFVSVWRWSQMFNALAQTFSIYKQAAICIQSGWFESKQT